MSAPFEPLSPQGRRHSREHLDELLEHVQDASDIFIPQGDKPRVMVSREIHELMPRKINESEIKALVAAANGMNETLYHEVMSKPEPRNFSYVSRSGERFRVSLAQDAINGARLVFRRINPVPWTLEEAGVPQDMLDVVEAYREGLVLVLGATGSGKSSLLSANVRHLVEPPERHTSLITIEDPVEFVFHGVCGPNATVEQEEVGLSVRSFADGVTASLRRRPTHILVGEINNPATARAAMAAARTGHLVFSTMHVSSVAEVFSRWRDFFPGEEGHTAMADLATSLHYAIFQRLEHKHGGGLVPAREHLRFDRVGPSSERVDAVANAMRSGTSLYGVVNSWVREHGVSLAQDLERLSGEGVLAEAA